MSSFPHHPQATLSEPEESMSSASGLEYFDEDDMYGASYDNESVQSSPEPVSKSSSDLDEMVWHFLQCSHLSKCLTSKIGLCFHYQGTGECIE